LGPLLRRDVLCGPRVKQQEQNLLFGTPSPPHRGIHDQASLRVPQQEGMPMLTRWPVSRQLQPSVSYAFSVAPPGQYLPTEKQSNQRNRLTTVQLRRVAAMLFDTANSSRCPVSQPSAPPAGAASIQKMGRTLSCPSLAALSGRCRFRQGSAGSSAGRPVNSAPFGGLVKTSTIGSAVGPQRMCLALTRASSGRPVCLKAGNGRPLCSKAGSGAPLLASEASGRPLSRRTGRNISSLCAATATTLAR
jgi:hypothetical protein